jgi:hypothetical protein
MSSRVGDVVFLPTGRPAVVTEASPQQNKLKTVDAPDEVRKAHRHGYINGLSVEQRREFDAFLDDVKKIEDPEKRIEEIQKKVTELNHDPRQQRLSKYLSSEMAHLMHTSGIKPRVYEIDQDLVR